MSRWTWIVPAGLVGVAATVAVVVRDPRRRPGSPPDDVRERLHRRVEDLERVETDAEARATGRPLGRSRD